MNKYAVTVKAFGHIRVMHVEAQSFAEAIRKARRECGIEVSANLMERNGARVAYLDGEEVLIP